MIPMNPKQTPATASARFPDSGASRAETNPTTGIDDSTESRWRRTAIAAFYRAQARGFAPGRELEDWLEAEREVVASEAAPSELAQTHSAEPVQQRVQPDDDRATSTRSRATAKRTRTTKSAKSAKNAKTTQGASLQARNRGDVS